MLVAGEVVHSTNEASLTGSQAHNKADGVPVEDQLPFMLSLLVCPHLVRLDVERERENCVWRHWGDLDWQYWNRG